MKARTLILTTGVCFALIVPAAHAAGTSNRLHQTQLQTVLWDKTHPLGKSKTQTCKSKAARSKAAQIKALEGKAGKCNPGKGHGTVVIETAIPVRPGAFVLLPAIVATGPTDDSPSNPCIDPSQGLDADAPAPAEQPLGNAPAAPAGSDAVNETAEDAAPLSSQSFSYEQDQL